jgi:hypothetical protein
VTVLLCGLNAPVHKGGGFEPYWFVLATQSKQCAWLKRL